MYNEIEIEQFVSPSYYILFAKINYPYDDWKNENENENELFELVY